VISVVNLHVAVTDLHRAGIPVINGIAAVRSGMTSGLETLNSPAILRPTGNTEDTRTAVNRAARL
jgi:hypothetical protein